ncbi:PilN domain-containing protein|uniref:PilN domain-containing protein n=1 Tax=Noviherbaspirillum sp. L7-7A TaxID=2850560 RepID=UPI001C2B99CE|nr:PilN domain-containing protein [Noviherbaspirillum sp. L7-7A]MBV0878141.1 PilN domain-containing protein [Noviherbaspirillum sp. L7-7A]
MSQQINLFNPVFLQQEKQFSALAMAQGLGAILLAVIAFTSYSAYQAGRTGREAQAVAAKLKAAQEKLVVMVEKTRPRPADKAVEEAITQATARLAASQQILGFVQRGQLNNDESYAAVMRALANRAMPGVWLTGLTLGDGGHELEIMGRAMAPELLPAYIRFLGQENALAGKSLGSMTLRAPSSPAPAANTKAGELTGYVSFSLGSAEAVASASQNMNGNER